MDRRGFLQTGVGAVTGTGICGGGLILDKGEVEGNRVREFEWRGVRVVHDPWLGKEEALVIGVKDSGLVGSIEIDWWGIG